MSGTTLNFAGRKLHRLPPCSSSWGCFPVRMDARDGVQEGAAQNALRNTIPSFARRSMFGGRTTLSPSAPACGQDQSSAIQKRIFGRFSAAPHTNPAIKTITARASQANGLFLVMLYSILSCSHVQCKYG